MSAALVRSVCLHDEGGGSHLDGAGAGAIGGEVTGFELFGVVGPSFFPDHVEEIVGPPGALFRQRNSLGSVDVADGVGPANQIIAVLIQTLNFLLLPGIVRERLEPDEGELNFVPILKMDD